MIRQFELVERVQSYDPDADEDVLNRAYVYGLKKHGTQLRASGDPYFSHPVEVAGILAEMRLDTASIVTGLLHDTIEDTDATRDEIARLFGDERRPAGRRRHQAVAAGGPVGDAPRRPRTCASSCWPCRRTSASCWSSWPTACTTCARCITSRTRRSASASRARPWTSMRRSPRASAWRRSSASSRSWPSPSSIPTAAPRCWPASATCASRASSWSRRSRPS